MKFFIFFAIAILLQTTALTMNFKASAFRDFPYRSNSDPTMRRLLSPIREEGDASNEDNKSKDFIEEIGHSQSAPIIKKIKKKIETIDSPLFNGQRLQIGNYGFEYLKRKEFGVLIIEDLHAAFNDKKTLRIKIEAEKYNIMQPKVSNNYIVISIKNKLSEGTDKIIITPDLESRINVAVKGELSFIEIDSYSNLLWILSKRNHPKNAQINILDLTNYKSSENIEVHPSSQKIVLSEYGNHAFVLGFTNTLEIIDRDGHKKYQSLEQFPHHIEELSVRSLKAYFLDGSFEEIIY